MDYLRNLDALMEVLLFSDSVLSRELTDQFKVISSHCSLKLTHQMPSENHLYFSTSGLSWVDAELGSLHVDFLNDRKNYHRPAHMGKNELIAKAIGMPKGNRQVFDATLGLAQDAWFLNSLGIQVTGCERSPILFLLLFDAVLRAKNENTNLALKIHFADAKDLLPKLCPQVVYVDPMFAEKKKKSLPRKEMQIFRKLVGADLDSTELLQIALRVSDRVVVKRPDKSEPLLSPVTHSFKGRTVRYDLYCKTG